MTRPPHDELILDQFTRQAVPFSTAKTIADESALQLLVDFSGAGSDDTVLDVACGGGLVVCAFARSVRHATGIDVTPAMLERARDLAQKRGLGNVTWDLGHAAPLPYPDGAFTIVVSRFAFHHFPDPRAVLAEMVRVCAPGGRVLVCDVQACDDPRKAAEFNRMEVLRDPSHVRAMPAAELRGLFRAVGPAGAAGDALRAARRAGESPAQLVPELRGRREDSRRSSVHRSTTIGWGSRYACKAQRFTTPIRF